MSKLIIEQCPETGICSIVKENGTKIDLMPSEVEDIRTASGDDAKITETLGAVDPKFSGALTADELKQISSEIK
jgi:hypothetical protein